MPVCCPSKVRCSLSTRSPQCDEVFVYLSSRNKLARPDTTVPQNLKDATFQLTNHPNLKFLNRSGQFQRYAFPAMSNIATERFFAIGRRKPE